MMEEMNMEQEMPEPETPEECAEADDQEADGEEEETMPGEEELRRMAEMAARMTLIRQQQWEEAAGDDLMLARALRELHAGEDTQSILASLNADRDRQTAQRLNMSPEELTALRDSLLERRAQRQARSSFAQELLSQEEAVRRSQPDFDLAKAIEQSPAFRALILAGEPVEKAIAYLDPERGRRMAEQAVAERIRRRSGRIQPMRQTGSKPGRISVDTMTEAELRRIDDKLKRGEHVRI